MLRGRPLVASDGPDRWRMVLLNLPSAVGVGAVGYRGSGDMTAMIALLPPPQARGSFQADLRQGGIQPWGNASWTVSKLGNGHHLTIGDQSGSRAHCNDPRD